MRPLTLFIMMAGALGALLVLPLLITFFTERISKRFIKTKVILWLINFVVFIGILGVELLIWKYYQAKQSASNFNYEEIGVRYAY